MTLFPSLATSPEIPLLWAAIVAYTLAGTLAIFAAVLGKRPEKAILGLMIAGLLLQSVSLAERWVRLGFPPFNYIFEQLSWNVWGLMVAIILGYWRLPMLRPMAALLMPIVILVCGWMMMVPVADLQQPVTYKTVWLFIHIAFIKLFLGCNVLALGMAGVILSRQSPLGQRIFNRLPGDTSLDELAYRFMLLALAFDSLGILAGAIWAEDAWGRYWAWDPLEVWSFLTWLSLGLAIHLRTNLKLSPRSGAWLVVGVFIVGFLTFFGVPFVSKVLHKGAI